MNALFGVKALSGAVCVGPTRLLAHGCKQSDAVDERLNGVRPEQAVATSM